MGHHRRGSKGGIDPSSVSPGLEEANVLDLTALTKLRRKEGTHSEDAAGGGTGLKHISSAPSLNRTGSGSGNSQDINSLQRVNSIGGGLKTPRSGRRGSRSGSISGLTAGQALALSAQYGTDLAATNKTPGTGIGISSTPTNHDMGGTASTPSTRRGSFNNGSASNTSISANNRRRGSFGGNTTANFADHSLKRHASTDGEADPFNTLSYTRRSSFSKTGSSSSRRSSRDSDIGDNISSSNHSPEFEQNLVKNTQTAMKKRKGRSIASIKKLPQYSRSGNAASERGITIITNNICLGGRDDASDFNMLQQHGVTHVLNVAAQLPNYHEDKLIYLKIPLIDEDSTDISKASPLASAFISRAEAMNGRVLIHCISGVSRSVTLLIMHFMSVHKMILKKAYDYVYSCRPFISPNDGFKMHLAKMELNIYHASSVSTSNSGNAWNFYNWNNEKASVPIMSAAQIDNTDNDDGDNANSCIDSIVFCLFGV